MKVLKIWDSEYPWDVRAEKFCKALTNAGHTVYMTARNRQWGPVEEVRRECTVHRMSPIPILGRNIDAALQFPAFFNPRWIRLIRKIGQQHSIDLILVRDLPLALTAISAGRSLGVPVVLDMAENYPAMIRDLWSTGTTRFGDCLIRNTRAVAWVEQRVISQVDHILVVVEESRERLIDIGVPAGCITVVCNTPERERLKDSVPIWELSERCSRNGFSFYDDYSSDSTDELRLVYIGLMEEARGVAQVIDALAILKDQGFYAKLDLIGDGRSISNFRKKAKSLGLESDVIFHGFIPYQEALKMVALADVGIIPHFANESWETTIPNKLFDYMSLGLPVVSSDVTPVKRVLNNTGAGVTFRDRNPADLAMILTGLFNVELRYMMGKSGRTAISECYNWEIEMSRMIPVLENLAR